MFSGGNCMMSRQNLLLGLIGTMFFSTPAVQADDTDIFLGKNGQGARGVAPSNIFFLLDSSSSMADSPGGGVTDSKMQIMKDAMADILGVKGPDDTLTNVNIGYGTFYAPAGLINYPVLPIDGTGINGGPVRNEVINGIQSIDWTFAWGTPLASAYYEAMAYMMGKPVLFGNMATPARPMQSNPVTFDTSVPPNYNFDGLTDQICASNSIVLLSDGQATVEGFNTMTTNDPTTLNSLAKDTDDNLPCDDAWGIFERCGREFASYSFNRDDVTDPDAPPIYTHTIGFGIDDGSVAEAYLSDVANSGGGQYHRASNKDELIESFLNIVNRVVETTSAFSAPTVPVSTSNRLFSASEIYLNLFNTERKPIWHGNVKKFEICEPASTGCDTGQYLGKNGTVAVDANGNLLDTGVGDVWDDSSVPSASDVLSGGLASKVPDWQSRNIYTWTPPAYPATVSTTNNMVTRGWELYKIDPTQEILTAPATEPNLSDNTDAPGSGRLRKRLYQAHGHCDAGGAIDTDCMNMLIEYLMGSKTRDTQTDGIDTNNRWPIADILHSEVLTIPYGHTTNGETINKIVFGTNDGGLHLHDAKTGEEDFVIYPQEVLNELANLEAAESGSMHIYGLDGAPALRIRDSDRDFNIEPSDGDFIHLYIGMRRGGYNYYAFNLTPDTEITSFGTSIGSPELLWAIQGSMDPTDPLFRLGQTWSKPQSTRIIFEQNGQTVSKSVLIFGGGYDPDVEDADGSFGAGPGGSNLGNAIYIVDADNGEVLWWTSSDYTAASGTPGVVANDMVASITGDIRLVDSNNDRRTDRLYAADLMGQVWRVDLRSDLDDNTVGRLASLSSAGDPADPLDNADERKFFYQPDFVRLQDDRFANSSAGSNTFDAIALVSGNRANPIDATVNNRLYMLRDYLDDEQMVPAGSGSPTNYPKCNPDAGGGCSVNTAITNNGLLDVSTTVISAEADAQSDSDAQALAASNGYYFDLLNDGELGFSKTQVLAGKMYFTTYDPGDGPLAKESLRNGAKQCTVDLGDANLYIVDILSGGPIGASPGNPTAGDRAYFIGNQPVTGGTPLITQNDTGQSVLQSAHQAGAQLPPDPTKSELSFFPTFWYQE